MAYVDIYTLQYKDYLGRHTTVTFKQDGFVGMVTEVIGDGDPVHIDGKTESDNMFSTLIGSFCDVSIISELPFQFIGLFNANKYKTKVEITKEYVIGDPEELFWSGYLLPDNYSEPLDYERGYVVSVSARDGLGDLKNLDFLQDSGNRYVGKTTPIKLISELLKKTKNELNINFSVNLVENYDESGSRLLENIYIDYRAFYNEKVQSCEYVLKQILQSFGCRIVQSWGEWWIERIPLHLSSHVVYKYDSNGNYLNSLVRNPQVLYTGKNDETINRLFFAEKQGQLYINPAFKGFVINQNYGKLKSIIDNFDFSIKGELIPGNQTTTPPPVRGEYVRNLDGSVRDRSQENNGQYKPAYWTESLQAVGENLFYLSYDPIGDNVQSLQLTNDYTSFQATKYIESNLKVITINNTKTISIKFDYLLKSAKLYYEIKYAGYWFRDDGALLGTQTTNSITGPSVLSPVFQWETKEILIDTSSLTSDITGPIVFRIYALDSDVLSPSGRPNGIGYIDNIIIDFVGLDGNQIYPEGVRYSIDIDKNNNETPEDIDSIVGDLPEISDNEDIYIGGYWRLDGTEFIPTKSWSVQTDTRTITLMGILAETIMDQHIKPKQKISGTLIGNFDFAKSLKIPFMTNKLYLPIRLSLSDKYCKFTGEFIELLPYTAVQGARVLGTGAGELIQTGSGQFIKV